MTGIDQFVTRKYCEVTFSFAVSQADMEAIARKFRDALEKYMKESSKVVIEYGSSILDWVEE